MAPERRSRGKRANVVVASEQAPEKSSPAGDPLGTVFTLWLTRL
jgi:hypothetical protein